MPKPKKFSPLTAPLNRKQLRKEVRAAGRLAVGPEKRIIQAERRSSKVQSRRIRDWFPQYGKAVGQAAQRTDRAYDSADNLMAQAGSQANNYAEQLRQRLAAEAQADANLRGVQYDPSGSLVNAQSQLARQNSTNVLRGVTAAQGASQQGYLQDKRRIGRREMVEQLLREQARRRSYGQDLRDLAQRQGDAMVQEQGRLRDSERDYYLGLLAARGEKAARRMSRKESQRDRKFNRQQARKDRQSDQSSSSGGGGGGDNWTPTQRRDERRDLKKAIAFLKLDPPPAHVSKARIIQQLIAQGYSRPVAVAAYKRLKKRDRVVGSVGGAVGSGVGQKNDRRN